MTEDDPPKTATEIQIEELQKQLSAMQSKYEATIKEYQDANKGLWAEMHKVPEEEPEPEPVNESTKAFDMDKAVKAFNAVYGIKENKE